MCVLSSDLNKFKKLSQDPVKLHKGQLQRYLREHKKKQFLDDVTYERIYPSGSPPFRLYDMPYKVYWIKSSSEVHSFSPIISSKGSFNYHLSRSFFDMLTLLVPTDYSTQDSFSFVKEVQEVSVSDYLTVSSDVCSLFTRDHWFSSWYNIR